MANTNSDELAAQLATPTTMTKESKAIPGDTRRVVAGNFEVAAADIDADGDTVGLIRLLANAIIVSLKTFNDDLDSGANVAFNVGIAKLDGTIVDEDAFASAVSFQAADVAGTEHRFESAVNGIDTLGERLWQNAGDSDDSEGAYAIVMYQTAAAAGAQPGTIAYVIEYSLPT